MVVIEKVGHHMCLDRVARLLLLGVMWRGAEGTYSSLNTNSPTPVAASVVWARRVV